jgi:hydroxyethylthiazole kinase-like uncharacterized protein yjeF
MRLVSLAEMRAIEEEANSKGISYDSMMERAGAGLANVVQSLGLPQSKQVITGLIGSGNNGGDALIALTALAKLGWTARAYLVLERKAGDSLLEALLNAGGDSCKSANDQAFTQLDEWLRSSSVILDGILGTGAKLVLKPDLARIMAHAAIFLPLPYVIAVDCPSGVDCNIGSAAAECIPADLTVCMEAVKIGLVKFPAFELVGHIDTVNLGLPDDLESFRNLDQQVVTADDVYHLLPKRRMDSHKGTFGTAMIVAGSVNYTGAPLLAARGAYKIGAGLVRVAIPGLLHAALAGQLPEATWLLLPHEVGVIDSGASDVLSARLDQITGLLLGPGWGTEEPTLEFLRRLLNATPIGGRRGGIGFISELKNETIAKNPLPPTVVDADGLKLLARIPDWDKFLPTHTILTPHPGEMSILTGLEVKDIQQDRIGTAKEYAKKWGHVVVLKGALTVIAHPDGRSAVIPIATSALARAGTGDILAGMITGLLAQGLRPFDAALAGAWMHARAGEKALEWLGHPAVVIAGDVIDALAEVFQDIEVKIKPPPLKQGF